MGIIIVTDSTCDLPETVIQELGIFIVPVYLNIGEQGFLDGVDINRQDFYTRLPDYDAHPTTGAPGVEVFQRVYRAAAEAGATQILSIHISQTLSATLEVARLAAREFNDVPVVVHDSRQLSMGTGFQVELAARMARDGAPMARILFAVNQLIHRTFVAASLTTLEYLRRSGRMNGLMTGIGSLLRLKPILTMVDGQPASERVRTVKKSESRLVAMLQERQPLERFALLHTNAPDKAAAFYERVSGSLVGLEVPSVDITPVIGVHIGPGAIGYALVMKQPLS